MTKKRKARATTATSLEFFSHLVWLDGTPLLDTVEPYRRAIFTKTLDTTDDNGKPAYTMVLAGRGKKNWKSADLVLAALYKLVVPEIVQGNDGLIAANDEGQAGDDLALAKKLIAVNPDLNAELDPLQKEIRRRDGRGSLKILPARDVSGAHGKTAAFIGYDEIHGYRNYDLLEALAPDPTRQSCLTWITTYDGIYNTPGVPLYDLKTVGFAGTDPRMFFSWYSGDRCTDPAFADLPPEQRANPSMASWAEGAAYLEQQKRRLPTSKYRRLHLNLPGAVSGAFFDQASVMAAIATGVKVHPFREDIVYRAAVDMSGGSNDDAVIAIGHQENGRAVLDVIKKQAGTPPFNPRDAIKLRFAPLLHEYRISAVTGDAYAGQTFRCDFEECGITYRVCSRTTSQNYEKLEPRLNAGEVELLDDPTLTEQMLTLVVRGSRVDHEPGAHDDFSAAAATCLNLCLDDDGPTFAYVGVPRRGFGINGPSSESELDRIAVAICGRTWDGRTADDLRNQHDHPSS